MSSVGIRRTQYVIKNLWFLQLSIASPEFSPEFETENPDVIRRALDAFVKGKADFADDLIAEVNVAAGCSSTLTFDWKAAKHSSFSRIDK